MIPSILEFVVQYGPSSVSVDHAVAFSVQVVLQEVQYSDFPVHTSYLGASAAEDWESMRDLASLLGADASHGIRSHVTVGQVEKNYHVERLIDKSLTPYLDDPAIEQRIVHLIHEIRGSARGLKRHRHFVGTGRLLDHYEQTLEIAWLQRSWKMLLAGSFASWEGYLVALSVTESGAVGPAHKEPRRRAVALVWQ